MFLSNKWNIKEVLLFPAMKPTVEQAERLAHSLKKASPVVTAAAPSASPPLPPVLSPQGLTLLAAGTDLNSISGLNLLGAALKGKVFIGGFKPTQADGLLFSALALVDSKLLKTNNIVQSYFSTVAQFTSSVRESWI
jgi:hypothetical protein